MYRLGTLSGHLRLISQLETFCPEEDEGFQSTLRLRNRAALITGGDSQMGRSVAEAYAVEGANIALVYHKETEAVQVTQAVIRSHGCRCRLIRSEIHTATACAEVVDQAVDALGKLDIVVNHTVEAHRRNLALGDLEQYFENAFRANVLALFHITTAAIPHLRRSELPVIINTASLRSFSEGVGLLTSATTQGAIISFTKTLSEQLKDDNIRVNAIAPLALESANLSTEGAECYVFLASQDASYMRGQILYPHGEKVIGPFAHL